MPYTDLNEEDVTSAMAAMQRAGVLEVVAIELLQHGFTMAEFLSDLRTPRRLMRARHAIWVRVYDMRATRGGERIYSTTELGLLFNRDDSTIGRPVRRKRAKQPL